MHEHGRQATPGLEMELSRVLEAEGIPLAYTLDDPDDDGPLVLTNGVSLLTDGEGAVIVTALAHDGHGIISGTAIEEELANRAHQTLELHGYTTTPARSDNTLRVLPQRPVD